jgi:hypothetical protein
MSNVLQRLAQRGAAPAAATGLAPLQMRPRSRFDTAAPGVETAEVAAAAGPSTPTSASSPPLSTAGKARAVLSSRVESSEARATSAVAPQDSPVERGVSTKAEPVSPVQTVLPDARRAPPSSVPPGQAEPPGPVAPIENPEQPQPPFAREPATPEPAPPTAETAERSAPIAVPFGADAAQAGPAAAEAPPSLSIGRLEVQFVQPRAAPVRAAPVRRGASGFADYARIRRGSPR